MDDTRTHSVVQRVAATTSCLAPQPYGVRHHAEGPVRPRCRNIYKPTWRIADYGQCIGASRAAITGAMH
jgi:hypothetical protein